ncbi:phospholipase D-like domain-containing protein [Planococcus maritimus]|uniref:phospholipase D-like domain-containing protein n=1 Tax=Planococcus maritimus TaxID=192421 RepID=UPI0007925AFF|nr:phospholipase D-like domain-containing protein [Planococcus maritimus]KYG59651.1 phospholipase [Planococcus maritimus]OED33354.1 phospholipase [Planococcus maritimus]
MKKNKDYSKRRRIVMRVLGVLAAMYIIVIIWHTFKPLPEGVSFAGDLHGVEQVEMIYDLSYAQDKEGTGLESELRIFDEIYELIDEAEEFLVLDLFLFDNYNDTDTAYPAIAERLADHIVEKKQENPDFPIYFITDPLNLGYGSYESLLLETLEAEGVEVIITDLDKLRDSMPLYSGLYRVIFQWFDNDGEGWIANAMSSDAPDMTLSSYMQLMNIKANHRKTVVSEQEAIVSSANPHDASGLHDNMAFRVSGPVLDDILEAEEAVSKLSGGPDFPRAEMPEQTGDYEVQYLTERQILEELLKHLDSAEKGDSIQMAMFYLSETSVVKSLEEASNRGVEVQLVLDPNENAFGNEKTGLPNRPAVNGMVDAASDSLEVRWYNPVVGQFHTKTIMIQSGEETIIMGGSANMTERTLMDYNLESDILIKAPTDSDLVGELDTYFDRLWNNEDALYTLDLEEYQDGFNFWQRGIYNFQKLFKLTTY